MCLLLFDISGADISCHGIFPELNADKACWIIIRWFWKGDFKIVYAPE